MYKDLIAVILITILCCILIGTSCFMGGLDAAEGKKSFSRFCIITSILSTIAIVIAILTVTLELM